MYSAACWIGLGYPASLGQSVLWSNGKWQSNNLDASGTAKAQTKQTRHRHITVCHTFTTPHNTVTCRLTCVTLPASTRLKHHSQFDMYQSFDEAVS